MNPSCPYDVSVIIPIYNVEEYLRPCLDSLMRQGQVSLQVIMVDDGSPDKSGMIADEYATKYSNFLSFHIPNGGQGNARNFGVKHAEGKYIAFLDSDDIIPDETYSRMFRISERDDSDITLCNMARFNSQRFYLSSLHNRVFQPLGEVAHIATDPSLVYDTCSTNKLIKRSFYTENNFICPSGYLYEDIPFSIHMLLAANKVSVLHAFGYLWREREGEIKSVTQKISDNKNLRDRIIAIEQTNRHFDEYSVNETVRAYWRHKNLTNDFMIFCNLCTTLSDEHVRETMDIVSEYVDTHMNEADFARLSPLVQRKYDAIANRDIDLLRRLREFELSDEYSEIEVYEENDRLMAHLPADLFGEQAIDVTTAIGQKHLHANITEMDLSEDGLSIEAEFFNNNPRVEQELQSVEISLLNEVTLQAIPLNIDSIDVNCVHASLRANLGEVLPATNEPFRFRYKISSKYFTYVGFLRINGRASRRGRTSTVIYDDLHVYLGEDPLRYPSMHCRDNSLMQKDFDLDSSNVLVALNTPNVPVRLVSEEDDVIDCAFSDDSGACAVIDTYEMPLDSECGVFATLPAGFGSEMFNIPVLTTQKKIKTHKLDSGILVVNTLRTGVLRLTRHKSISKISEISFSDEGFNLLVALRGFSRKTPVDHFEIVAQGLTEEEEPITTVLAATDELLPSKELAFEVPADKLAEATADTVDNPVISIHVIKTNGSTSVIPIYSIKKLTTQLASGEDAVKVFRNIHGQLSLKGIEIETEAE